MIRGAIKILLFLAVCLSGIDTADAQTIKRRKLSVKEQLVLERQRIDSLTLLLATSRARENELDTVGCWIDYLTDCLGFRLIVEYDNDYTTIDGYTVEDDWSIGFYVYLRALGASSGDVFGR